MTRTMRLLCLLIIIPLGIAVRYAPLHLPWFWSKYLGSALWAMALYFLIAAVLPKGKPAVVAAILAVFVELSRLVPEPHIDHFRTTLAGRLLLGRYFAWTNIAVYLAAIALAAAADHHAATGK